MSYRTPYPLRGRPLRRHPTDAEQLLWSRLRAGQIGGAKFRRQEPIGPYVVDFCALVFKLIVEVDGGQHVEHTEQDSERTAPATAWLPRVALLERRGPPEYRGGGR